MRHRVRKNLKFNNKSFAHRDAMERNLLTSFFLHKSIMTTEKKAKLIVPMIDKLINVVKITKLLVLLESQLLNTETEIAQKS